MYHSKWLIINMVIHQYCKGLAIANHSTFLQNGVRHDFSWNRSKRQFHKPISPLRWLWSESVELGLNPMIIMFS